MCTVATIVWLLGYMPHKGAVLIFTKEQAAQYTPVEQLKAKRCMRRFGIELRVGE